MGYLLTVYNPLQNQLNHIYSWTDSSIQSFYEGLITSLIPLGAIIANFFSSRLFEHFGRKKTCFLMDGFCILSTILTLFSELPLLIIGRLGCGIAGGVNLALVSIYVKEMSPLEHAPFFGSMGGFMLNFGMVASFLFGMGTLTKEELNKGVTDNWWRVMFAFPIVICVLRSLFILLFFNYESPLYLVKKNRQKEALKILNILYKNDPITEELLSELQQEADNSNLSKFLQYKEIFEKKYYMRFLIALMLVFGNQYSGVNAIAFYSKSLFTELGGSDSMANKLNGILGAVNLISGLLIVIPLKVIGTRKTYLVSAFGGMIMLGLVALFVLLDMNIGSLVFIFGYYFFFSLGIGPIIFMVIPQLLPEKFVSVIFLMMNVFSFIIGLTFPLMIKSSMNVDGSFLFFACCCFTAFLFNYFYLPDTSGKTSEEVVKMFEINTNATKEKNPRDGLNNYEYLLDQNSELEVNLNDRKLDLDKFISSSTKDVESKKETDI